MADKSAIEWTDATWNPIVGCSLVSPACTNCYAMAMAARLEHMAKLASARRPYKQTCGTSHYAGTTKIVNGKPVWTGKLAQAPESVLLKPLTWKKPRRIFVNSMSDLFHESVPDEWLDRIFAVMALAPQHTFQVLTKRPKRMREYFETRREGDPWAEAADEISDLLGMADSVTVLEPKDIPLPNVWLGCTVEDQPRADERIPELLATPAAFRFVSTEPMLGAVDLRRINFQPNLWIDCIDRNWPERFAQFGAGRGLDLVIAGGESGPGARPTPIALFRSLRDQCAAAGVAFDFKQWGEWIDADEFLRRVAPERVAAGPLTFVDATKLGVDCLAPCEHHSDGSSSLRVGKRRAGRMLDGREHNEFPEPRS